MDLWKLWCDLQIQNIQKLWFLFARGCKLFLFMRKSFELFLKLFLVYLQTRQVTPERGICDRGPEDWPPVQGREVRDQPWLGH